MTVVVGEDGRLKEAIQFGTDRETGLREFGTRVIERADAAAVIREAYKHTAYVVLLVRDRLEREKPIEAHLQTVIEEEA